MIDLLFSTYNERLSKLIDIIPVYHDNINIIIVHQVFDYEADERLLLTLEQLLENRADVSYFKLKSRGVAKSRNYALLKATSKYALFCDDDAGLLANIKDIISYFDENKEAKFLTFSYKICENIRHPKFKPDIKKHNLRSILSVGTIEIAIDREFVVANNISFPEDLGAGMKFNLCDEPVFLSKIIKCGGKGIYMPVDICIHPTNSSGELFDGKCEMKSRLIAFRYIFGSLTGVFVYYIFLMKNIYRIKLPSIFFCFFGVHFFE